MSSIMSPLAAYATDPDPSPSAEASESPSAEPSAEPSVEPSVEPESTPDPAPDPTPAPTPAPDPSVEPTPEPSAGEVVSFIVTFAPGTDGQAQAALLDFVGAIQQASVPVLRMRAIDLPADSSSAALATLRASSAVERVDIDR